MLITFSQLSTVIIFGIVLILYVASTIFQYRLLNRAQNNNEIYVKRLASANKKMDLAFELNQICYVQLDLVNQRIHFDERYVHCLGFSSTYNLSAHEDVDEFSLQFKQKQANDLINKIKKIEEGVIDSFACQLLATKTQQAVWIELRLRVAERNMDNEPLQMTGYASNIDSQKMVEKQLKQILHFDNLTGLPNRYYLKKIMKKHIQYHTENNLPMHAAGVFIDIDNFKMINDVLGHQAGDVYLKLIANIMAEEKLPKAHVSRLSGDEFFIYIEEYESENQVEHFVNHLLNTICSDAKLEFLRFTYIQASAGIAFYNFVTNESKIEIDELIQQADIAMFRAKDLGKNRYMIYTNDMADTVLENYELLTDMRDAYDKQEFVMYYQPIVNTKKNQMESLEALIRWNHPQKGLISPAKFIPIAEMSGEICRLGQYVLEQSLRQINAWKNSPMERVYISVNMSPTELLQEDVVDRMMHLFDVYNVPTNKIQIEITENILIDRTGIGISNLDKLKALGFSIALDDFGAEYSSLSMLNEIDFSTFKIDKYFIQTYDQGPASKEIFLMIKRIAEKYRKNVIVEGVETEEQLEYLREMGFSYIQGYYYSKPMPVDEISLNMMNKVEKSHEFEG